MRMFILSLAIIFLTCGQSFAFTANATKTIYPVFPKTAKSGKIVYGIYAGNRYWAVVKKPKITKLTKSVVKKTVYPCVTPYHVKLFMRFGNVR